VSGLSERQNRSGGMIGSNVSGTHGGAIADISNAVAATSGRTASTLATENTTTNTIHNSGRVNTGAMQARTVESTTVSAIRESGGVNTGAIQARTTEVNRSTPESSWRDGFSLGFNHSQSWHSGEQYRNKRNLRTGETSNEIDEPKPSIGVGVSWRRETGGAVYHADGSFQSGALQGESSVNLLRHEGYIHAGIHIGPNGFEASMGVGGAFSVAEARGYTSIGDGNLGMQLGGDVTFGRVAGNAGGTLGFSRNELTEEYELNAYLSLEVNAVLAEVNVYGTVSVGGVDFGARAGVYVGVGLRVDIGFKNGEFVFDIGAALGIGINLHFTIGFNEEFFNNIRNMRLAAARNYATNNPHLMVNTALLRSHAIQISNLNARLEVLNREMAWLLNDGRIRNVFRLIVVNLFSAESFTLNQVAQYFDNAAERLESTENQVRGLF